MNVPDRPTQPPRWQLSRWVFLRLLGVVALIAFASYFVQVDGLVGSHGIWPAAKFLDLVRRHFARDGVTSTAGLFLHAPTVFWFGASDAMLTGVCVGGMVASVCLVAGVWPRAALASIWLLYLSLANASGVFMGYQWDALLIETAFFAVFFAPSGLFERRGEPASRPARLVLQWLVFRLMFMSGVVKLISGPTWRDLSAMTYHYWTQPIPAWTSYFAYHLPAWFHHVETAATLVLEIAVPPFLFAPRALRRVAALLLIVLQLLILATGNFGFFNLLAIALCLACVDDAVYERLLPDRLVAWIGRPDVTDAKPRGWRRWSGHAMIAVALVATTITGLQMLTEFTETPLLPSAVTGAVQSFRTMNNYGLFRVMTTQRPEILVEGSNDGEHWKVYDFKYKPDHLDEAPGFIGPHMPRLDWQMWFAALGHCRSNMWLVQFQRRLLEGSPTVLDLLAANPFPTAPPTYIRTVEYDYHFTTAKQRARTGHWWRRARRGPYCPALTLREGKLQRM